MLVEIVKNGISRSMVVKIVIRIVRSYDPTIPHSEKESDRSRIAHLIGSVESVGSYDPMILLRSH
jgi:hypothetical protein